MDDWTRRRDAAGRHPRGRRLRPLTPLDRGDALHVCVGRSVVAMDQDRMGPARRCEAGHLNSGEGRPPMCTDAHPRSAATLFKAFAHVAGRANDQRTLPRPRARVTLFQEMHWPWKPTTIGCTHAGGRTERPPGVSHFFPPPFVSARDLAFDSASTTPALMNPIRALVSCRRR